MADQPPFRFTIPLLPEGEALTGTEIEQKLQAKLAESGGTCTESLWSLAALYQHAGHLDQASGCMQRVIDLTQDLEKLGSGYLALGQLEESRGDFSAAAKHYRSALGREPCSPDTWYFIHNNLGYSLNQLAQHAAAIPYLEEALKIDPSRPNAYKNLGIAFEALGELDKAAKLYIAATRVNSTDPRALRHLTLLLEANPALEVDVPGLTECVEECRKAVELAGRHQPDFKAHWENLRTKQKRRWWEFWK